MNTVLSPVPSPPRPSARGALVSLAAGVAAALVLLVISFSTPADAAASAEPEVVIRMKLDGGHADLDALANDHGMSLLSTIVEERQTRADGEAVDMAALSLELARTFASVDLIEGEVEYKVIYINGRRYEICEEVDTLVVTDPQLDAPTSVSQSTTMQVD